MSLYSPAPLEKSLFIVYTQEDPEGIQQGQRRIFFHHYDSPRTWDDTGLPNAQGMMFPNLRPQRHPVTRPDAIGPEKLDHVFSETRAEPSPQDHHLHREEEEQRPAEEMGEWNS